jgi:phosphopantetheinyl transferase
VALKLAYRTCLGLQVPLEAVETWNDRLGRPHVGAPGGWHCSVSHTVGWALAAVSATPVGIDVESLREVDPGAIRLVAAPDEWGVVEGSTPPEAAALRLWTVKEAVLKGLGTGFRLEPRSVRVVAASEQSAHVDVAGEGDSSSRHWRVSSEILEDRVVSIAHVRSHLCSARIRWIDGIGVSAALDAT